MFNEPFLLLIMQIWIEVICNYLHLNAGNASDSGLYLYRCLCHRHCCCHSSTSVPPTTSPVPLQPDHAVCHILLWLVGVVPFSNNRNLFSCLQTLPACGHLPDKSPFLPFLPAPDTKQTWWQCSRKSVADIIYHKPSLGPVQGGVGLS